MAFLASHPAGHYAAIEPHLIPDEDRAPYRELAVQLSSTEGSARLLIYRMRRKFRERLEAKVFGAGRIVPGMSDIGARNAKFAVEYLERERIPVLARDFGRGEASKVYFFPHTGRVLVKRLQALRNDTVISRERDYAERLDELARAGPADLFV